MRHIGFLVFRPIGRTSKLRVADNDRLMNFTHRTDFKPINAGGVSALDYPGLLEREEISALAKIEL
jgi:hypothetical protein